MAGFAVGILYESPAPMLPFLLGSLAATAFSLPNTEFFKRFTAAGDQ